jgi:endoglucanase
VDGYLWFGRPWLYMQADPFVMTRALQLARTTPY